VERGSYLTGSLRDRVVRIVRGGARLNWCSAGTGLLLCGFALGVMVTPLAAAEQEDSSGAAKALPGDTVDHRLRKEPNPCRTASKRAAKGSRSPARMTKRGIHGRTPMAAAAAPLSSNRRRAGDDGGNKPLDRRPRRLEPDPERVIHGAKNPWSPPDDKINYKEPIQNPELLDAKRKMRERDRLIPDSGGEAQVIVDSPKSHHTLRPLAGAGQRGNEPGDVDESEKENPDEP